MWTAAGRKQQLLELLVFCLLITPSLVVSFLAGMPPNISFPQLAIASIARDIGLVCLIAFFLWRNGESVRLIGWRREHALREAAIGLALFIPLFFTAQWVEQGFMAIGLHAPHGPEPFLTPRGSAQFGLAGVLVAVVAVSEETIFRGYFMLRVRELTRSTPAAVFVSTALFAVGHGYEGMAGLLTVAWIGAVFAVVYLWRGSLAAPMVMHFCQDFLGIVVAPLVQQ